MSRRELPDSHSYTLCEAGAYDNGRNAYHLGATLGDNPYCPGLQLDLYEAWGDGWVAAESESVL